MRSLCICRVSLVRVRPIRDLRSWPGMGHVPTVWPHLNPIAILPLYDKDAWAERPRNFQGRAMEGPACRSIDRIEFVCGARRTKGVRRRSSATRAM